ncbi:AfsA-related hotdog domain-containing protein [Gryllotalpicola reticulitermitis]|uniref:AfsA-related hotdog domain-containing protein n=1 Tax=Gryllotalpicola reticulitermitis TaxID=1184153 RepID=A0ABV8Q7B5_9MICO
MPLIDRSAAHRSTRSESLVWAIERAGEQAWRADVEIPRSHWLCHPVPDRVPVTLLAEAFRQAGLAICVAGLGMGQSVRFVVSDMTVRVETDELRFPRFGALDGKLEADFTGIRYRKGVPHVLEVDYRLPGLASGHVNAQVLADRDYRAIRRNAVEFTDAALGAGAELIQVTDRGPGTMTARLGIDESDPFFFDHPVDHVPGMLLLHAAERIHEGELGTAPRFLTISFPAFGELRSATDLQATLTGHGVETSFAQGHRVIGTARSDSTPYRAVA